MQNKLHYKKTANHLVENISRAISPINKEQKDRTNITSLTLEHQNHENKN